MWFHKKKMIFRQEGEIVDAEQRLNHTLFEQSVKEETLNEDRTEFGKTARHLNTKINMNTQVDFRTIIHTPSKWARRDNNASLTRKPITSPEI